LTLLAAFVRVPLLRHRQATLAGQAHGAFAAAATASCSTTWSPGIYAFLVLLLMRLFLLTPAHWEI
jgi:hypothetical protein